MASVVRFFVFIFVFGVIRCEPIVNTSLGTVTGKTETYDGVAIESFFGIPYAKPPVGELRFALPQAVESFGDIEATEYSASCPQTKILPLPPLNESEDCLYLNIFRKTGTKEDSKKPVIFLIHGGAFCVGSASQSAYNALPITAVGDVVVVSINYRLGVLGFADMKGLAPGNLGLFDQLLALEWVHDNIAAFGGDPEKVTLVGVSAGSMSVSALVNTPLVRGKNLFKQAVMDAGVMSQTMIMGQDLSLKKVRRVAARLGCETEGEKMLSCLRAANATQLVDASVDPEFSPILTFAPTVDGKLIAVDPSKDTRENSDKFADVRMIVGVAKDEGTLFGSMYPAAKTVKTKEEFIAVSKEVSKGFLYPLDFEKENIKEAVAQTYYSKFKDHERDISEFISDGTFICPTNAFVKNYAKTHKNVFVYNFEKVMKRKYLKFGPEDAGAHHGSPFSNMFGGLLAMSEEELGGPLDPEDEQFTMDSVDLLADFVNSDAAPKFRGVTWPNYSKGEGILIIDDKPSVGKELVHQDRCRKVFPFLESE